MSETLNASDIILAKARDPRFHDRKAIVHGDDVLTYGAFETAVARAAAAFAALGLQRGERVCFLMIDSPLFCAAFLGALKAGAVAIPVNTRLPADDLSFIVADSGARLVVADTDHLATGRAAAARAGTRSLPAYGTGDSFEAAVAAAVPLTKTAPTAIDEPAFWLYSSGTTGSPKAIIHSHANAAQAGKLLREIVHANENTVVLGASKFFFAFGLDNAFLGPLSCGATTLVHSGWPDAETIVEQVLRHRPNVLFAVPTFFRRLLALPKERLAALASVALNFTGGERLPDAVAAQWHKTVGTEILSVHGMSETFCNTLANRPGQNRVGTCGTPLEGVETKLVDDAGRAPPPGEPGVLWVKHPSLALGYRNAGATARAFRDGWFCTGDLFTCDRDGFWTHQGRADDLIKVAGQWVRPAEIEDAVLADPRVREAACVVVPDQDGFERLALFVVGSEADMTRIAAARLQSFPRHSQPKWIRATPELPRTTTGKIQRFVLRERLAAELGDPEHP